MVRRISGGIRKLLTPPDVVPCEIYDFANDVMIKTSNGHGFLGGVER